MLAAVILSGGASRRMGSPKALLPYQGRPFLEHLLDITKHPRIGARRVVLGADAGPIIKEIALPHDEIVVNHEWRSEEHTSELQSHVNLVCRLLLEKKKKKN